MCMEPFETASTGDCRLTMFGFFVRVKAGIHTVGLAAVWARVLNIMFHFLERSFFIKLDQRQRLRRTHIDPDCQRSVVAPKI